MVASVARNEHADALLVERDFSPSSVRIAYFPRQSRPSAAASATASLASTFDSAAAPARALAAPNTAPLVSQAALQLAAFGGSSVPSHQRSLIHFSRFPRLTYLESPAERLPRAELPRAEPRMVELNRLVDPQAIPTMTPTRRNAIGRSTSSEKANS